VTSLAPDGVIEALELPQARFCVGVQWHPENFVESGTFLPLFAGLLAASTR
jgi:putative glutamine amidotransferase